MSSMIPDASPDDLPFDRRTCVTVTNIEMAAAATRPRAALIVLASGLITDCPRRACQTRSKTKPRYVRPAVQTRVNRCPSDKRENTLQGMQSNEMSDPQVSTHRAPSHNRQTRPPVRGSHAVGSDDTRAMTRGDGCHLRRRRANHQESNGHAHQRDEHS